MILLAREATGRGQEGGSFNALLYSWMKWFALACFYWQFASLLPSFVCRLPFLYSFLSIPAPSPLSSLLPAFFVFLLPSYFSLPFPPLSSPSHQQSKVEGDILETMERLQSSVDNLGQCRSCDTDTSSDTDNTQLLKSCSELVKVRGPNLLLL